MAPEYIPPEESTALCRTGLPPYTLTGLLRKLLISHFSAEGNITYSQFRTMMWQAAPGPQNILIESITQWKPSVTEKRPAILISRNDYSYVRWGIGDRKMGGSGPADSTRYEFGFAGSHTMFCVSRLPAEAELLGQEVFFDLAFFAPAIATELNMIKFVPVGIGKLMEIEEAHESYAVPVTFACVSSFPWVIMENAPTLNALEFEIGDLTP